MTAGGRSTVLSMLGMARRAGAVVSGTDAVRAAVRESPVGFAILAEDASATQRKKLEPLLEARGVGFTIRYTRRELGAAVGRPPATAVLVTEAGLAGRIRELLGASGNAEETEL